MNTFTEAKQQSTPINISGDLNNYLISFIIIPTKLNTNDDTLICNDFGALNGKLPLICHHSVQGGLNPHLVWKPPPQIVQYNPHLPNIPPPQFGVNTQKKNCFHYEVDLNIDHDTYIS